MGEEREASGRHHGLVELGVFASRVLRLFPSLYIYPGTLFCFKYKFCCKVGIASVTFTQQGFCLSRLAMVQARNASKIMSHTLCTLAAHNLHLLIEEPRNFEE